MIKNARFTDPEHKFVSVERDGAISIIPTDPANRDYQAMQQASVVIADYKPLAPTADDVRAAAQRRMIALLGARDGAHLDTMIVNDLREAVRLLRKGRQNWTPKEADRAAKLEQIDTAIEAIGAASNAMETNPPEDYADDKRWL